MGVLQLLARCVHIGKQHTTRNLPIAGAEIYRINLASRMIQRLTHEEFTPNTGSGNWLESNPVDPPDTYNRLGYGILNLGPAPLAGGKIIFSSNRNGLLPVKSYTFPVMQLFVMDEDGANVTPVAPMTHGSALHPTVNADHPTETTRGDVATLPGGSANVNVADLDYTGTTMPPPGSGATALSADEKMTFARWIDLGCPVDTSFGTAAGAFGWMQHDLRPTLEVSLPRPGMNDSAVNRIRVGVADAYIGIASGTLSITSIVAINGRAPGAQLADLAVPVDDGVYVISVSPPVTAARNAHVYASVRDVQGNVTRVDRSYSVGAVSLGRKMYLPLSRRP